MERPVDHLTAGYPAGSEDQVNPRRQRREQPSELLGTVRSVGVHLHQNLIAPLQPPPETRSVGRSQPVFARAVKHVHGRVLGGQDVDQLTGAIWRRSPDDQDVDPRSRGAHRRHNPRNVSSCLVRWDHDQDVVHDATSAAPEARP